MALRDATARDVHVHTHPADQAQKRGKQARKAPETAPAGATRARVIPLRPDLRQEVQQDRVSEVRGARRGGLETEVQAAVQAAAQAARESDWARPPVTVVDAAGRVFPAKGETASKIVWVGMAVAGAVGLLLVCLGHLIAKAGEGRIRASAVALVLTIALILSYAAGHAA